MAKKTLRSRTLELFQLLRRLEEADDNGYCKCVTCGHTARYNEGIQGGHFIPKGKSAYLALDPRNVHPQCRDCNGFDMQFGTAMARYTLFMVDKYGREIIDEFERDRRKIKKLYAADYRDLMSGYKEKIKFHKERIGDG